jgi:hypothetical protein
VVPLLRSAIEDSREFPGLLTSTIQRRGRPSCVRNLPRPAYPLLVEAIGEGELSAALAPKVCAFGVPHRKRPAEHQSIPALLTAGFSGHDPHRIMHMCGLDEEPVWLAEVASIHGRSVSMQPAVTHEDYFLRRTAHALTPYSTMLCRRPSTWHTQQATTTLTCL